MLPPGARGPESPEGIPSRGSGEAHEAGAPSRSTHREPISKRRGGWGEPRPEMAADQAPWGASAPPSSFPSIEGGRSVPPLRAHRRSRRARETAGARPLSAPPVPGRPQQPKPARAASLESSGRVPGVRSFHRHP
ncbi:hypothetical protein NDU88_001561 [Pleurodeles waltl]|uniref:Uncharacterized protein n=1 Tax=Pleurodeles waltl TaxID=8319 RepID=A0AAV7LZY8_PLEWA|nr:hypothetical protein NDU88_001561 [Pleurodeles waltl]